MAPWRPDTPALCVLFTEETRPQNDYVGGNLLKAELFCKCKTIRLGLTCIFWDTLENSKI